MKIGYFTDTYYPQMNGVSVSIDNFVRELRKRGHKVYIIAPKLGNYEDKDKDIFRLRSIKFIQAEPEARLPLLLPTKSLATLLRLDLDLIHAHGNGAFSLLGYQVALIKRLPYILTFHTLHTKYTHYFLKGKVIRPMMVERGLRVFANICDGVITPSEKMKKELVGYGVRKPIKIIPNFISISKFKAVKKGFLHERFKIAEDKKILLSVGRLGKEKNFEFIIKTFQKLTKKHENVHLIIVGPGKEEDNLKALAASLDVEEKTHFTGKVETALMPRVYADADIFVFASETETQGIALLEAAASGLPLVVVDDLAFKGVAVNGKNSFTLPLKEEAFVEKIEVLLEDGSMRERFGENSKRIANENSNEEVYITQLLNFYRETTKRYKKKERIIKRIANKMALIKLINATSALNRLFR